MSRDQENALIVVLGVVGALQTCSALYEWSPGDKFATTMAVVMLVWMLFFTTWVVQRARYARPAPRSVVPDEARDRDPVRHPGSRHGAGTAASPVAAAREGTPRTSSSAAS